MVRPPSNPPNPFQALQQNAEGLFDQIQDRNASKMACRSGCSACCHAHFSVFTGEALLMEQWFFGLPESDRQTLRTHWENKPRNPLACAFLRENRCTIYPARPIICRTQGAPLRIQEKTGERIDACPLNFDGGKSLPRNPSDHFDLDRLTRLQSIAEKHVLKSIEIPVKIRKIRDEFDRVPLDALQTLFRTCGSMDDQKSDERQTSEIPND